MDGAMERQAEPLPFTRLYRHELRNAIRLVVWRKELIRHRGARLFRLIDADLRDGLLAHQRVAWTDAFREAERIGETQTEATRLRATDLLHLGIAFSLKANEFLSFDEVQRKAATRVGLRCKP